MLNVTTEVSGETIIISLEGLLDSQTTPQLEAVLEENLGKFNSVQFDFANLEYLTSAGLRAILVARQEMDDKNGVMTVKNIPEDIMKIFEMTGFADVLEIE
ncbi:MAG: STAS domain-containing protein [Lachnospiraceae bacterium]|nr:STAS domain-containing protein [Lachnospiraceae bacterium]